jgi:hypothetical protein
MVSILARRRAHGASFEVMGLTKLEPENRRPTRQISQEVVLWKNRIDGLNSPMTKLHIEWFDSSLTKNTQARRQMVTSQQHAQLLQEPFRNRLSLIL